MGRRDISQSASGEIERPLVFRIEQFRPDWGSPPGDTLGEFIDEAGWTQADLAHRMGVSPGYLSDIISARRRISPRVAVILERETQVSAEFWAARQAHYDVYLARKAERER